jgi:hypothetical protein
VHGFFGDIKISEQARQRSENPARFGPVKRLYEFAELFGNIMRHAVKLANERSPHNPRTAPVYAQFNKKQIR